MDESIVWDTCKRDDVVIEINVVKNNDTHQWILVSEIDIDVNELEGTGLETCASMVVFGRNGYIVNNSKRIVEVHLFSPDHEALKVSIVDAVAQCDGPYSGGHLYFIVQRRNIRANNKIKYRPSFPHEVGWFKCRRSI